jgi:hypothetical protein
MAVTLIFIPRVYFEISLFNIVKEKGQAAIKVVQDENNLDDENNTQKKVQQPADQISLFEYRQESKAGTNKCKEFFSNLKILVKHKIYMVSTCSVIVLLFIVTAIQFWITDYLLLVLKIERAAITIAFVVTCVTAPTLGIVIGGIIVQKYGGYETKIASLWCVIFAVIAGTMSILIPIMNEIIGFAIVLWLFFFFGGAIVPNIIGIYISTLPKELRGAGNSVSNTLINAFGYLPAPYVYGAIFDKTKLDTPKLSLAVTVNYCWVGVGLLTFSMILRYRSFNKKENQDAMEMEAKDNEKNLYNSKIQTEGERDANEIKIEFSDVKAFLIF